jgi:hypothetical protein
VDDSGLEVDALGGAPGVYSARFAGPNATDAANNQLLLDRMRGVTDRTARFVCVVALAESGRLLRTFRGEVEGRLLDAPARSQRIRIRSAVLLPAIWMHLRRSAARAQDGSEPSRQALRKMREYLNPPRGPLVNLIQEETSMNVTDPLLDQWKQTNTARWRSSGGCSAHGRLPGQALIYPPGFHWAKDLSALMGSKYCMHAHVGFMARGQINVRFADGCVVEYKAPKFVQVEPGHEGWVVGDEPAVLIEFDFEGDTLNRLGVPQVHKHGSG